LRQWGSLVHFSSYAKGRKFVEVYGPELPRSEGRVRVLEVGSKSHHIQDTYRGLFDAPAYAYTGLDIEAGPNVDIVPANPFVWKEVPDCSFEVCISGQTFEHNPYFWVTFAEMARVLVPGGIAFVVAPGGGSVHRYPVDCWRFYPDAWPALCGLSGMELVESYFEEDELAARVVGGFWRDSAVIARKPPLRGEALAAFHQRLRRIVGPLADEAVPIARAGREGPWVKAYREEVDSVAPPTWRSLIRRKRQRGVLRRGR
jgi:SAM-dependent methyltransferase